MSDLDDLDDMVGLHIMKRVPFKHGATNPHHPTHCIHGHEFTPENTRVNKGGNGRPMRQCRACARERKKLYRAAKAAS